MRHLSNLSIPLFIHHSFRCSTTSSLAASILPHFTSLTPHFFSSSSTLSSVFFDPSAVFHFKSEANWRNVASTFFRQLFLLLRTYVHRLFNDPFSQSTFPFIFLYLLLSLCPLFSVLTSCRPIRRRQRATNEGNL